MTVQFNVREDSKVEVNNLTLILNLKSLNRSRKFNTKNIENMTEREKKCIDDVMAIVEKYVGEEYGGQDVKYTL